MNQLTSSLSSKLNLPEPIVRHGVGIILNFLKEKMKGTEFEKFAALIPDAQALMGSAPAASPGGLGGLLSAAGALLGGQSGGDLGRLIGSLQNAGISAQQAAPFAAEFLEQAKAAAGPELLSQVLASAPGLSEILQPKTS